MYRGFGVVPEAVLSPTLASNPVSPEAKLVLSWKTPLQSYNVMPMAQPPVPSLVANTYTTPAVESTIGPCTMPGPASSAMETSKCPEIVTPPVELTAYRNPPLSATNTFPDTES